MLRDSLEKSVHSWSKAWITQTKMWSKSVLKSWALSSKSTMVRFSKGMTLWRNSLWFKSCVLNKLKAMLKYVKRLLRASAILAWLWMHRIWINSWRIKWLDFKIRRATRTSFWHLLTVYRKLLIYQEVNWPSNLKLCLNWSKHTQISSKKMLMKIRKMKL
jgi:hypothetical protein